MGCRVVTAAFFDQYSRFLETSNTSAIPERLNARYRAVIEANRTIIKGARVLDIGSHDGRWSFAVLQAGAAHVTGIEPRSDLIKNALDNMRAYGIEGRRYAFIQDDIFNYLKKCDVDFDVVMCLGYFYHTIKHLELVSLMTKTAAKSIILDTEVFPASRDQSTIHSPQYKDRSVQHKNFIIQILKDPVSEEMMASEDEFTRNNYTLVGRPSADTVHLVFEHFGWVVREFDWSGLLAGAGKGLQDYRDGWRKTFLCVR